MAQRLTLAQLREQFGLATDVTVNGTRYPNTMVDLWINQAIQEAQMLRVEYGTADEAKTTATITATDAAQTGGYLQREVAALPADFMALKSVYLVLGSTPERYQLQPVSVSDREAHWRNARPCFYGLLDAGQTGTVRLRLWPPADQNYTLDVEYYPEHPTLVNVGDLWEYPPGCQDLVIAKAAMLSMERDGETGSPEYQGCMRRYNEAVLALRRYCKRDPGLKTMRNTRDYRVARRYQ